MGCLQLQLPTRRVSQLLLLFCHAQALGTGAPQPRWSPRAEAPAVLSVSPSLSRTQGSPLKSPGLKSDDNDGLEALRAHAVLKVDDEAGVGPEPEIRWAFMPSSGKIRLAVLSPPAAADHWSASLQVGSLTVASTGGQLSTLTRVGRVWPVEIKAGPTLYNLSVSLFDKGGAPLFSFSDTLQRSVRPWEGKSLGREHVVLPGFEPIKVVTQPQTVIRVVGREYTLNSAGLWSGVAITPTSSPRDPRPAPVDILAAPMALVAVFGETEYVAAGAGSTVLSANDTWVHTHAVWTAGPLSGTTSATYDIDGCAVFTLTLEPTDRLITELTIRVPLRDTEAPLYHAVTDHLHEHEAGSLPKGNGEVFNTTNIPRAELDGPFVPYLWAGSTTRGLAIFSDSDRDWLPAEPAYSITRHTSNSTLVLQVNLISRNRQQSASRQIRRQRKIVLGMMASPAKPQPTAPVSSARAWWPVSANLANAPNTVSTQLLASSLYWGQAQDSVGFYPYQQNYSIFKALATARQQGNFALSAWADEVWFPIFTKECDHFRSKSFSNATACQQDVKSGMWLDPNAGPINRLNCLLCGFRDQEAAFAASNKSAGFAPVFPYTNPQSILWDADAEQFMDEWTAYDIADPRWQAPKDVTQLHYGSAAGGWRRTKLQHVRDTAQKGIWQASRYYRDPVASYVDMALYYIIRLYEWADGIYFDNAFLNANYQLSDGPGYINDEGELRPGVNLFAWRDLLKRTAVLQHQLGLPSTMIWVHKTNVNIIAWLSWSTISYDWEWRDSGGLEREDVQTRNQIGCDDHGSCNDTHFILAQTNGEPSGTIPIAIDSGLLGPSCANRPDLPAGDPCLQWLTRTHYATTLVHEVRPQANLYSVMADGSENASCARVIPASPDGSFAETPAVCNVSNIMIEWGYASSECDVYRFWEQSLLPINISTAPMNASAPDITMIHPLLVRCPRAMSQRVGDVAPSPTVLVVFGSFGPGAMVEFELAASLGITSTATAFDAETGQTIQRLSQSPSRYRFRLDRHNFRMIAIKTDDEPTPSQLIRSWSAWHVTDIHLDPYYVPGGPTFECFCETAHSCPLNCPKSCFVGAKFANGSIIPPAGIFGNSEANCATPLSLYNSALAFMAEEDKHAAAIFMTGDFGEAGE